MNTNAIANRTLTFFGNKGMIDTIPAEQLEAIRRVSLLLTIAGRSISTVLTGNMTPKEFMNLTDELVIVLAGEKNLAEQDGRHGDEVSCRAMLDKLTSLRLEISMSFKTCFECKTTFIQRFKGDVFCCKECETAYYRKQAKECDEHLKRIYDILG